MSRPRTVVAAVHWDLQRDWENCWRTTKTSITKCGKEGNVTGQGKLRASLCESVRERVCLCGRVCALCYLVCGLLSEWVT